MVVRPFVPSIVVFMAVMLVVLVRMGVGEPFVPVEVPVHFAVEEEHPG